MNVKHNPMRFAVVREDPVFETNLIRDNELSRVLLIASGGCTALHLKKIFPELFIQLVDANLHQLDLVKRKIAALPETFNQKQHWNIGVDNPHGLNGCGNFESLFRQWRQFILEFVVSYDELCALLFQNMPVDELFSHPFWTTSFDLFFSDALLITLFGRDAVQHAPPNSYPRYFQAVFERGFVREDRARNYFLHHLCLGYYHHQVLPDYLKHAWEIKGPDIQMSHSSIQDVVSFADYDLISLSNIFDWLPQSMTLLVIERLRKEMKKGAYCLVRQLNNQVEHPFGKEFDRTDLDIDKDQSHFYNAIKVYQKRA